MVRRFTDDQVDQIGGALKKFGTFLAVLIPLFSAMWWAIGQQTSRSIESSAQVTRKEVQEQFQRSYQNRAQERRELSDTIEDLRKQLADVKADVRVIQAVHEKEKR